MENLRWTLLNCPLIQAVFNLPADEKGYRTMTKDTVRLGHIIFTASSFEEQQASRHARIIVNDDLVNEINHRSELMREEIKRKWRFQKSVSSQIKEEDISFEIDCGTPYHHQDLMWYLMKENKTYDKFIMSVLSGWPNVTVSDVLKETRPLTDPKLMSFKKLREKLDEQGNSIFSSQYLLKPLGEQDALCPEEWVKYWKILPEYSWRTMVIDAGGSIPGVHDATGITVCDTDPAGNLFVVYADELWLQPLELIKMINELTDEFRPDDTRIEKEKYATTIADIYEKDFPLRNISFVKHDRVQKPVRIWRLRQWFQKGRIFIGANQRALLDQLLTYPQPESGRDDILDSLAYHLDIMHIPKELDKPRFIPDIEAGFDKEFDEFMKGQRKKEGDISYDNLF